MMRVSKRKGFTLVELLIVIVVIGILASAMMLASGSATDSAKASSAISELRSAKAAGLLWFADNPNYNIATNWAAINANTSSVVAGLGKYMDNLKKTENLMVFASVDTTDSEAWIGIGRSDVLDVVVLNKIAKQSPGTVYFADPLNGSTVSYAVTTTAAQGNAIFMRVK